MLLKQNEAVRMNTFHAMSGENDSKADYYFWSENFVAI